MDAWRFENTGAAFICGPAADYLDSNSSHLSTYSMSFTRFLFTVSALEEMYRFVDHRYQRWATKQSKKGKSPTLSIRAALLVDQVDPQHWPEHFEHVCRSFSNLFKRFSQGRGPELSGMGYTAEGKASYSLHLLRNLRNHIAHGMLLPGTHPDYAMDASRTLDMLHVIKAATHLAAVYIQLLASAFQSGFQSNAYRHIELEAQECEESEDEDEYGKDALRLLKHCSVGYLRKLHVKGPFAVHRCLL